MGDPRLTKEHEGTGQVAGDARHEKKQKNQAAEESEEEETPGFISGSRIDIRI
jgi:hypothetical protein